MLVRLPNAEDLFPVGSSERNSSDPGDWNDPRLLNDRNPDLGGANELILLDIFAFPRDDRRLNETLAACCVLD